jgi:two-component sensor histidine kinase/CheY-like chemotaxis protein
LPPQPEIKKNMDKSLRILMLEDDRDDAELVVYELRQAGFDLDWRRVDTAEGFLAQLDWPPDLVLADYSLPQFDALRALHCLQERGLDFPFIVVTGSLSEEVAVECMKQGATDYLLKDRLTRLGPAVKQALEQKKIRDQRKRDEERIRASLREKEVLLKEIQHRVKNNLQVIASLLNLQSGHVQDEQARQALKESQNRIRAMALVHQKLYQSPDVAKIGFAQYIRELATQLFRSFGVPPETVSLKVQSHDIFLGVDTAIPCALIINELVTNSLKHAFPEGRKGEICIDFQSDQGQLALTVSDNGVGLSPNAKFPNTQSLGWQLVSALTDQLDAQLELRNGFGTTFHFTFRELKYRERG